MDVKKLLILGLSGIYLLSACSSQPTGSEEDFATQDAATTSDGSADMAADGGDIALTDEFSEAAPEDLGSDSQPSLEGDVAQDQNLNMDSTQDPNLGMDQSQVQNDVPVVPPVSADPVQAESLTAPVEPSPIVESAPAEPVVSTKRITNIEFKGNEAGGTLVISGSAELKHSERLNDSNPSNKQLILEFSDTQLDKKASRPLYLKDFKGSIGAVSSYFDKNTNSTKVILELRGNAPNFLVQPELNSLLIVTNESVTATDQVVNTNTVEEVNASESNAKPNSTASTIFDGLSSQKFEGREISCNFNQAFTKDLILAIGSEVGVNMVVDDIPDSTVDIDIQSVPWDHCLALIMKLKRLGFTRIGNIIRVTTLANIKAENEENLKSLKESEETAALKVRLFPINYAEGKDLEKFIQPLLTAKRGSVSFDSRTNSFIVTDSEDVLQQIGVMIKNLDTPPRQVMIEGKVVEASTNFSKQIGISWGITGQPTSTGGKATFIPRFNIGGATQAADNISGIGFSLGTLDFVGNLTASLQLLEKEDKVKVLSSPRVVTINNKKASIGTITRLVTGSINQQGTPVTTEPLELKVNLEVTPQINNDGSVKMEVKVKREFAGVAPDSRVPSAVPRFTRDIDTNVLVRNGQTSVIGGVFQNDTANGEVGLPGLRDIPILGFLFRQRQYNQANTELLVFLTPKVLSYNEGDAN